MAKKLETRLKEKVLAELRRLPKIYVVKIQQEGIHGTLDIHICCRGYFIAIELKSDPIYKLEPRQQYEADQIDKAMGIWFRVDPLNWPETLLRLSAFSKGALTHAALASNK